MATIAKCFAALLLTVLLGGFAGATAEAGAVADTSAMGSDVPVLVNASF